MSTSAAAAVSTDAFVNYIAQKLVSSIHGVWRTLRLSVFFIIQPLNQLVSSPCQFIAGAVYVPIVIPGRSCTYRSQCLVAMTVEVGDEVTMSDVVFWHQMERGLLKSLVYGICGVNTTCGHLVDESLRIEVSISGSPFTLPAY